MSKKRNAWNALSGSPYARTYSMFTGDAFHAFPKLCDQVESVEDADVFRRHARRSQQTGDDSLPPSV